MGHRFVVPDTVASERSRCARREQNDGPATQLDAQGSPSAGRPEMPDVPCRQRLEHRHLRVAGQQAQRHLDGAHGSLDHEPSSRLRTKRGRLPRRIPWTVVNPKTQPFIHLKFEYAERVQPGGVPFGANTPIEGGQNASGDRHALMVDPATCVLDGALRRAVRLQDCLDSGLGRDLEPELERPSPSRVDLGRCRRAPDPAGLLLYQEVLSGKVDHAIRFTTECTDTAYIWPARHEAGSCGAEFPPMGARFRLSAGFSASEICKAGTPYCAQLAVVIKAMQHYGLILATTAVTGTSREARSPVADHARRHDEGDPS